MTTTAPALTESYPDEEQDSRGNTDVGTRTPKRLYVVLSIGLIAMVTPFVWMILSSFKTQGEIRQSPPTWLPANPTWSNYSTLFSKLDLTTFFVNSLIVAVAVTLGNLVFCSMLGYALAKLDFGGKRALFAIVLGTLMILMRQYIAGLPDELIHAARVDGAGEFRIFWNVILPMCGPALATLGILTFLGSWNNFLWPLVVAQSEDKYTLPVALALYSIGQNSTNYGLLLAGAVVVVLPVIAVFLALQRSFVQGISTTGLK
ncbi:MAG: carbohydrate ABC transporter permease [Nocardioidaceae bacterium]